MVGGQIKGFLAAAARRELKNAIAPNERSALVSKLPDSVTPLFTQRLLATRWYPLDGIESALQSFAVSAHEAPRDFCRRMGRQVGHNQAGSIGRALLSTLGTPERIARLFPAAFRHAYDSGVMVGAFHANSGRLEFHLRDWLGHGDLMCMTVLGTIEEVTSLAPGYQLLHGERTHCVSLGARACTFALDLQSKN